MGVQFHPQIIAVHDPYDECFVDFHSVGARGVLDALGLTDMDGECAAVEFHERVLLAELFAADTAPTESRTTGSVTFCGEPANALANRLAQLRELAELCVSISRPVVWG